MIFSKIIYSVQSLLDDPNVDLFINKNAAKLYKENKNYKLMLIGQGPLQDEIKQKVKKLGIEDVVMFLG